MAISDQAIVLKPHELLPSGPVQAWPIYWLGRVIDWGLVIAAALMIALVFFNVCTHAAGFDLAQTTEVCEMMMVWVTFLGGASITRRSGQMVITEFIDKIEGKARFAADFAVQLVSFVVLGILFWAGIQIIGNNWGNYLVVLNIPMAYQYMPLAIGSGASMVFVAYDLYQIMRGIPRDERYGVDD